MNYNEIDLLKKDFIKMVKSGWNLKIDSLGIDARIVGIGFKPLWTSPSDSKIEKIEFNILDRYGRIQPLNFYNVVGYEILTRADEEQDQSDCRSLEIFVFSNSKSREAEPYNKVKLDFFSAPV